MSPNPCIEIESVRAALEAMRQAQPLGLAHPLMQFISIKQSYPGAAIGGTAATEAAIFRSLAHLIRKRLNQHRAIYGLPEVSWRAGESAVQDDFRFANDELEVWSVLYYRYVRVDLSLSIDRLERLTRQDRRTLNRRQSRGIVRLTYDLARREALARARQRRVTLCAQLPLAYRPRLVGRETLIRAALERLESTDPPRHLLIYGAPGVGKSALALAVAHFLIERQPIQNVAWIDRPDNDANHLLEQVAIQLGLPLALDSRPALASYLQIVDTLIVLDHAQALLETPQDFIRILGTLGSARLLINVTHLQPDSPNGTPIGRLYVDELDKAAALDLLARAAADMGNPGQSGDIDHFARLYGELGGNPRALRMALSAGSRYSASLISTDLYGQIWKELSHLARLVWLILALRPAVTLQEDTLCAILPDHNARDLGGVLGQLADLSVVERDRSSGITLTPLAKSFVEHILGDGSERVLAQTAVHSAMDYLTAHPSEPACLHLLASVYHADVPVALRLDLAYALAPVVEHAGAWTAWASTLESLRDALSGTDYLWCGLHLGIARRWLTQWSEAAYLLSDVMQQAGQAGDFALQADAMVELAAVYRYQEQHELAGQLLDRAQHFYQRHGLGDGLDRITADRIQMALDADDIPAAQNYLREIDRRIRPPSPRLLSLAATVALHADDLSTALELAQLARQELSGDKPQLARVVAQLGHIYYRRGDSTSAINHLTSALAMMEQNHDLLGHARTRMNLAAVYLGHGNLRTALRYLRDLPADLERLGDASTLQAALKNLDILNSVARHWVRPGD